MNVKINYSMTITMIANRRRRVLRKYTNKFNDQKNRLISKIKNSIQMRFKNKFQSKFRIIKIFLAKRASHLLIK